MVGWWKEPSVIARVLDGGSSQVWRATYSDRGYLLDRTDPVGRDTTYSYDQNGIDLLAVNQVTGGSTDPLMIFGNYQLHKPQLLIDTAGQSTTVAYNGAGQVAATTNARAETTVYGYAPNGYLTSVTRAIPGSTTTFAYDGVGRLRTVTLADGFATTIDYDAFDRPVRVTYPDATYESFGYDRLDVSTMTDREHKVTRLFHDANRQLISKRDPLGRTTTFTWCSCGSVDSLTDGEGHTTRWERDVQGRVIREIRADGTSEQSLMNWQLVVSSSVPIPRIRKPSMAIPRMTCSPDCRTSMQLWSRQA